MLISYKNPHFYIVLLWLILIPRHGAAATIQSNSRVEELEGQGDYAAQVREGERLRLLFHQQGDRNLEIRTLLQEAQDYLLLGNLRESLYLLVQHPWDTEPPAIRQVAFSLLGEIYRRSGNLESAIALFHKAWQISPNNLSILNNLGNAYRDLGNEQSRRANLFKLRGSHKDYSVLRDRANTDYKTALVYYQRAAGNSSNNLELLWIKINALSVLKAIGENGEWQQTWDETYDLWQRTPISSDKVWAGIELANMQSVRILAECDRIAKQIGDLRARSYVLGELAKYYENNRDYQHAFKIAEQALVLAENANDRTSIYLRLATLGHLYKLLGQETNSIHAYSLAVKELNNIKAEIAYLNKNQQFDFRDTIEPIYRELAELQLSREQISEGLSAMDSLQIAELQNYLGVLCDLNLSPTNSTISFKDVAILKTIIFSDRTALLLTVHGETKLKWLNISAEQLRQLINEYRRGLENYADYNYNTRLSKQLYDLIIRPFDNNLIGLKSLVFVPDGILRTVPISALHDGEKYLIEKMAVTTTPSLALLSHPTKNSENQSAFLAGVTKASVIDGTNFPALIHVRDEISKIEKIVRSTTVLDSDFTLDKIRSNLNPYVHIATHGEFGYDSEESFIVGGNNQKIKLNELAKVVGLQQLELITLDACTTAVGDDRAALGIAGVVVQSGARSALASLWFVNDESTAKLSIEFYRELKQGLSKTEALRQAQIQLIHTKQFNHPSYWSAFLLVGNWN